MADEIHDLNGVDADRLLKYIERIEKLEEEKKTIQNDIKEVFDEIKATNQYDVKAIKQILKLRKKDEHERQEEEFIVDQYKKMLGME